MVSFNKLKKEYTLLETDEDFTDSIRVQVCDDLFVIRNTNPSSMVKLANIEKGIIKVWTKARPPVPPSHHQHPSFTNYNNV